MAIRISDDGLAYIDQLAERETGGNRSEMIRLLLSEAVASRQKR